MESILSLLILVLWLVCASLMFSFLLDATPFPKSDTLANWLFIPVMLFVISASLLWPITGTVVGGGMLVRGLKVRKAKRLQQVDKDFDEVIRMIYE